MLTKPRNNNITISSIVYKCLLYYIFPQILFFSFVLFFLLCSDHLLISLTAITMISVWTIPTSISIPIRNRRARFSTCFSHIITSSTRKGIRTLKTLSLSQVCMPIPSFEHNKTISYQLTVIYELLVEARLSFTFGWKLECYLDWCFLT